jgi:hypothetical protein
MQANGAEGALPDELAFDWTSSSALHEPTVASV